jgi:tetratricopeptide (TPR) repeat protein
MSDKKPVIFISYSHKDEPEKPALDEVAWLTFVQSFLAPVVKVGIFDIWVDEHLHGGEVLDPEIKKKLADCDIFVLLASRHSLASTYVVETEIATIRQRQKAGEDVHMFPVLLSPVPNVALKQLKDLVLRPRDAKPFSTMNRGDRESAMSAIADEIATLAEGIAKRKIAASKAVALEAMPSAGREAVAGRGGGTAEQLVDTSQLPETAYERLVGREVELERLDDAWADRNTNILSLIAEGGAGKSALVNEWLKRMQTDNYRGAEIVLGWSFYSQGTKERATSAEQFLIWAIEKLGIRIEATSATAKGEAIAEEMMKRRVLLVLDGCEPLQHGLDKQQGELKDQGLRALLRRFSSVPPTETHGLVTLTSRLVVKDIAQWKDTAAPVLNVEQLSEEAGAALLRDNGVWGTDKQLQAATQDFGGHPLALGLLASFLHETQFGDVRRRDHIRGFFSDPENPGHDHARRVMESYEKEWLAEQPLLLAIMHMVGLFDRPANNDCLRALRKKPAIKGLTDRIVHLDDGEWQRAVARLREIRLLAPRDPAVPDALDAHPLVREWFSERLLAKDRNVWRATHSRLFDHLRRATKEGNLPTLEALAPLYQAIAHGCCAGRYKEAFRKIYMDRICRREADGTIAFYANRKLGAVESNIAAIYWFFEKPYDTTVAALDVTDSSSVLSEAAFYLRALGRFAEALPSMRAVLQMDEEDQDWRNAANGALNLSETELIVGEVTQAAATANRSINCADRSCSEFGMMASRVALANALHSAGRREKAAELFVDAERRQKKILPEYPQLYSVGGYRYCDLLLAEGDHITARGRIRVNLPTDATNISILDVALDLLTRGRTHLDVALDEKQRETTTAFRDNSRTAFSLLNDAVDHLRSACVLEFIALGHLARSAFRRSAGDWPGAMRDLDEVGEIAEPGLMKLFLCDMALERARLVFARLEAFAPLGEVLNDNLPKPVVLGAAETARLKDEAAKQLAIAADYIKTCGYHKRDDELAELEAVLGDQRRFADLPPRV